MGFTADAGILVAAEGSAFGNAVVAVHPHTAGFNAAGNADGPVDISGPDCAAKAVLALVGHGDDFIFVLELDDAGHGSEDFFLGHAHVVGNIAEQGGTQEAALGEFAFCGSLAAAENCSAFFLADFHVFENLLHLALVDLAAHLGGRIKRQADLDGVEALYGLGDELVVDAFLYKDTGACAADLALVEEDAHLQAVHGHFKVAVIEEDVGRLAAQFQRGRNDAVGCSQGDLTADFGGAGEGQLAEALVVQHVLAGLAAGTGDDVEDACGNDILHQLGQFQHAERGFAGRLDNCAAAAGQHGGQLPGSHQEGEVPGNNLADNTDGLAHDNAECIVVQEVAGTFFSQDAAGKVTEVLGRHGNVHIQRFTDGLAVVQGFDSGQVLGIGINDVCNLVKDDSTFLGSGLLPGFKGLPGRGNGCVNVFLGSLGDIGKLSAVGRAGALQCSAVRGILPLAAVEQLILFGELVVTHGSVSCTLKVHTNNHAGTRHAVVSCRQLIYLCI